MNKKKVANYILYVLFTLMLALGVLLIILFLSKPSGINTELLKSSLKAEWTPILIAWFLIFLFFFFYVSVIFYKNLVRYRVSFVRLTDYWDRLSISIVYALIGVMVILILSKSSIIFTSGFGKIKGVEDTFIQLLGILLIMVTVILTAGSIFLFRRLQKIDRLEEHSKELRETTSISANLILSTLPPLGITIHVPHRLMHMLEEIDGLIRKSDYLRDYIEDEKNRGVGPRIQLAQAIYRYGRDEVNAIDILKDQVIKRTIDLETYLPAKLRLGIAYRQFGKYKEAYDTFGELKDESENYLYYNTLARIGLGFTKYAEFKDKVGWRSGVWGPPQNPLDEDTKMILIEAHKAFRELWNEGREHPLNKNAYVSDYLAKICYDLKTTKAYRRASYANQQLHRGSQ
jgi:hypothetical protein